MARSRLIIFLHFEQYLFDYFGIGFIKARSLSQLWIHAWVSNRAQQFGSSMQSMDSYISLEYI